MPYAPVTPSAAHAQLAFQDSARLCRGCRSYHGIWPFMRLARYKMGLDADHDLLLPILARNIHDGARLLLAGSADCAPAELMAKAAGEHRAHISVIDLCETPLAQARALQLPPNLTLEARVQSLLTLADTADTPGHDLILAHSVLAHLPPQDFPAGGRALASGLVPGGVLVLTTQVGPGRDVRDPDQMVERVLLAAAARGLSLPGPEAEVRRMTRDFAVASGARFKGIFADTADMIAYFEASGLEVIEVIDNPRSNRLGPQGQVLPPVNRGAVVVARKPGGRQ